MERYLIELCSPTLASLKSASLFSFPCSMDADIRKCLWYWNDRFSKKGIHLIMLCRMEKAVVIYVFRKSMLKQQIQRNEIIAFLERYGYQNTGVYGNLAFLKTRFQRRRAFPDEVEFPHEIGVFLGYPLGDVIGFIENKGKNYKYLGYWKVYCNETETCLLFERLRCCFERYQSLWQEGATVVQLTVSA